MINLLTVMGKKKDYQYDKDQVLTRYLSIIQNNNNNNKKSLSGNNLI